MTKKNWWKSITVVVLLILFVLTLPDGCFKQTHNFGVKVGLVCVCVCVCVLGWRIQHALYQIDIVMTGCVFKKAALCQPTPMQLAQEPLWYDLLVMYCITMKQTSSKSIVPWCFYHAWTQSCNFTLDNGGLCKYGICLNNFAWNWQSFHKREHQWISKSLTA